jgi:hypothetical protein
VEAALAVLRLVRDLFQSAGDGDRARALRVAHTRVRDLAVQQIEEDELVEQRDGDVTGDARPAIALGVREEVAEVDVGEPRSREKNAAVWKLKGGGRRQGARAAALRR